MKKREEASLPDLPHIKGQNITALAFKAKTSRSYVFMILNGDRRSQSAKAKRILAAAKALNESIEKGMKKADSKLEIIDQD